jgi:uncharacterized membrane protein
MAADHDAAPSTGSGLRFDRLDALRGLAIVWMVAFHFSFDLNHLGFWTPRQNFYADPFWTWQRTAIVSLFLFCAGLSQAVALQGGQGRQGGTGGPQFSTRFDLRFWRRWAQIAGCALLVSAGSAVMFPGSWISFGVLHAIAVMLILLRLAAPLRGALWLLGLACMLLPLWVAHPVFDTRWTNWVGLVTRKPITEDFVPMLPWLGVMLWGLAAGRWLLAHRPAALAGPVPSSLRPLAVLGRWSLSFYMVHQPVLIGVLMAVATMRA